MTIIYLVILFIIMILIATFQNNVLQSEIWEQCRHYALEDRTDSKVDPRSPSVGQGETETDSPDN